MGCLPHGMRRLRGSQARTGSRLWSFPRDRQGSRRDPGANRSARPIRRSDSRGDAMEQERLRRRPGGLGIGGRTQPSLLPVDDGVGAKRHGRCRDAARDPQADDPRGAAEGGRQPARRGGIGPDRGVDEALGAATDTDSRSAVAFPRCRVPGRFETTRVSRSRRKTRSFLGPDSRGR